MGDEADRGGGADPLAGDRSPAASSEPSFPTAAPVTFFPPGWYDDPWAVAVYRFWDGSAWSTDVSRRRRSMRVAKVVRVAFVVASVGSGLYLALWVVLFPLVVVNDADNGCLGHDVTHVWLPLVATSLVATVSCVTMAVVGIERRSRWWVLLPASCVVLALAVLYAVPPVGTCS
ncbi:MAG: DUF2510 domain-containing protein [Acidimicrobiales bacterium]